MKKIAIGVILVMLVILGAFLVKADKEEDFQDEQYERWMEERLPLRVEQEECEQALETLTEEYIKNTTPRATTHIIFTDLNEKIYNECRPLMKKYGYTGTLALSSTQLPGQEDCMSVQQFQKLTEAGWRTCIQWDERFLEERLWNAFKLELDMLNIQIGEEIYFPLGTYSSELDEQILEKGFSIAICEQTDEEMLLQSEYKKDIWQVGACGFMSKQPKKWLKEAVAKKANIVYTVTFLQEEQMYDGESFEKMLESFDEFVSNEELLVEDLIFARQHYKAPMSSGDSEYNKKYQQDKKKLEERMKEIDEQLKEIDAKYQ